MMAEAKEDASELTHVQPTPRLLPEGIYMTNKEYGNVFSKRCVKELLWIRQLHVQLIDDIDRAIKEVCKEHGLVVSEIDQETRDGQ